MKIEFYISHKINVAGGTLLSMIPTISENDLMLTGALGVVGAFVSFVSSLIFGFIWKRIIRLLQPKNKDESVK